MDILIRKAKDHVYDVYEGEEWIFSTIAPDNLFKWLSEQDRSMRIKFIDVEVEEIFEKIKNL